MKVLVIDNYDSFVYNLVQYIGELGAETIVYRNDQITLLEAAKMKPDRIVISPGPGNPEDEKYFGVCTAILQTLSPIIPTLGVCLGHQGIIHAYGGKIIHAKKAHARKNLHHKTRPKRHLHRCPQPLQLQRGTIRLLANENPFPIASKLPLNPLRTAKSWAYAT